MVWLFTMERYVKNKKRQNRIKGHKKNHHLGGSFLIIRMMERSSYSLVAKVQTVRTDVACAIRF